jgi:ribosomal protein S27AE
LRWFAAARDVEPEQVETTTGEELFALEIDGSTVGEWPSEASFLAETVVRSLLHERIPDEEWDQLAEEMHREVSARLLLFLERCPSCGGTVTLSEAVDDDEVLHLSHTCTACGATLFRGTQE